MKFKTAEDEVKEWAKDPPIATRNMKELAGNDSNTLANYLMVALTIIKEQNKKLERRVGE